MADINFNDLDKLPQYKAAFDSLRDSINGLDRSIGNLDKSLSKYNKQNQETVTWGTKIKNTVKDLVDTYDTAQKAIGIAGKAFQVWTNIASTAFTLITTYGPKVLDVLGKMFQSDKTRAAAQALKDYKEVMDAYTTNVSSRLAQFDTLKKVAQNDKLPHEIQVEAIKQLNQLSPTHLQNLTLANVKTQEGTKLLNEYSKSLNRLAMEESVQDKKAVYIKQRLAIKDDLEAAQKEVDTYNNGSKKDETAHYNNFNGDSGGGHFSYSTKDAAKNRLAEKKAEDDELLKQIAKLDGQLAKNLLKYAPSPQVKQKEKSNSGENKNSGNDKLSKIQTTEAEQERLASIARMAEISLDGYAKEVTAADNHFKQLKEKYKNNKQTVEQLEKERVAAIEGINKKFQDEDLKKLEDYKQELLKIRSNATKTVEQLAIQQVEDEYSAKLKEIAAKETLAQQQQAAIAQQQQKLRSENREKEAAELDIALQIERDTITKAGEVRALLEQDQINAIQKIKDDAARQESQKKQQDEEAKLTESIQKNQQEGHVGKALQEQLLLMDMQRQAKLNDKQLTEEQIFKIEEEYARKKAAVEDQLMSSKIHAGDRFIDAALKNSKKDSAIYKAAFLAKKATSIADTIISTKHAVMESLKAYAGIPFIGQALGIIQAAFMAGQGALSIAEIVKQKPGFAKGGQFNSDGRGALLSGYSRMDDTNAYLRSGEAVVVSEAMRNPWARNLVSAINVAYGGRDFSVTNPGRGYAIGGIFTDGGNSNRYYNQAMNDQKDLANTIAYQMINNFPLFMWM